VCSVVFSVSLGMVRLIKMCLKGTHSRVLFGKFLYYIFPAERGLIQGDAIPQLLFNYDL
jgi:hypothetical protein